MKAVDACRAELIVWVLAEGKASKASSTTDQTYQVHVVITNLASYLDWMYFHFTFMHTKC